MKGFIKIVIVVVILSVGYLFVSLHIETPASERARTEQMKVKGYFETFDLNQMGSSLEKQGYSSVESLSVFMSEVWQSISRSTTELYQSVVSFDGEQQRLKESPKFAASIPGIWPINRGDLKSKIGAFGLRIHPIYGRIIMHKGIDLACDTGSLVYATGDGVVERSEQGKSNTGYGQMIVIDHGYGYKSRYAHLSRRNVSAGDRVSRGDVIGLVGCSGGSTGAHLHYEVIVNGRVVNPKRYLGE